MSEVIAGAFFSDRQYEALVSGGHTEALASGRRYEALVTRNFSCRSRNSRPDELAAPPQRETFFHTTTSNEAAYYRLTE